MTILKVLHVMRPVAEGMGSMVRVRCRDRVRVPLCRWTARSDMRVSLGAQAEILATLLEASTGTNMEF